MRAQRSSAALSVDSKLAFQFPTDVSDPLLRRQVSPGDTRCAVSSTTHIECDGDTQPQASARSSRTLCEPKVSTTGLSGPLCGCLIPLTQMETQLDQACVTDL